MESSGLNWPAFEIRVSCLSRFLVLMGRASSPGDECHMSLSACTPGKGVITKNETINLDVRTLSFRSGTGNLPFPRSQHVLLVVADREKCQM